MNSSKKYILVSSSDKNNWGAYSNLGHELFFTRKIVLILLLNKLINNDEYIIVTANDDRKFLYNKIFDNVLTFNQFKNNKILNGNVIDLCPYLSTTRNSTIECLNKLGLSGETLTSNQIFKNYNTETMKSFFCYTHQN